MLEEVEGEVVTADDFDLFLRHFYFSNHYCYPPYLPKTDIDSAAISPPLSLHFPPVPSIDWSRTAPLRCSDDDEKEEFVVNEALLTLTHYLDCARMAEQCEAVFLRMAEWGQRDKQQYVQGGAGCEVLGLAGEHRSLWPCRRRSGLSLMLL